MHTPDGHGLSVTVHVVRGRMRAFVQIAGGVVVGLGLGAAIGLNPSLFFAAYIVGLGLTLLLLGLLLPEDPDAPAGFRDRPGGPRG